MRALEATAPIAGNPQRLLLDAVEDIAQIQGDAEALISERGTLTYRALVERSHRYARWALDQNLAKGRNGLPDDAEPAGLHGDLARHHGGRRRRVAHQHAIARPVACTLHRHRRAVPRDRRRRMHRAVSLRADCPAGRKSGRMAAAHICRIDREIERFSAAPLTRAERRATSIADRALTIYTSGTTGLPKAANVSHRRLLQWSLWFAGLMNTGPDDRMYDCLPMYHSIGGVVATGALLVRGGSVVIREKFSASTFWDDVVDWDCTLFQYIGELCRYLVNAPHHPRERQHRLRLCCGNGLRAEIWQKFQSRFAIPRILEFYAATEGNVSLYNVEGKVGADRPRAAVPEPPLSAGAGAVRRRSRRAGARWARTRIRCATDEVGEAIGRIGDGAGRPPAANSRAIAAPRTPSGKFCATCSSRATPGSAPAI